MTLRETILDCIETEPTFSQLKAHVKFAGFDVEGEHAIELRHNLLICWGISEEFMQIVSDLRSERLYRLEQVSLLDYLITTPAMPLFPVAKQVDNLEPHWIPVRLHPTRR